MLRSFSFCISSRERTPLELILLIEGLRRSSHKQFKNRSNMKTKEVFLSVPGYSGLYEVSNLGNVMSLRSGKLLKQSTNKGGYKMLSLTKNGKSTCFSVHRLVAMTFLPNPDNLPEVNHKDENPGNNFVDNLEWCTRKYNLNYGGYRERMSKTMKEKPSHHRSVSAYFKDTMEFFKSWGTIKDAEIELGLSRGTIGKALSGQSKTSGGYIWKYNTTLTISDIEDKGSCIDISQTSAHTQDFLDWSDMLEKLEIEL